ncbi:MAG: glycosyltransferase [Xanthomonadaceae bacterium]|nr:glycosyltransferase [Xanthomonadaceae bacterium]
MNDSSNPVQKRLIALVATNERRELLLNRCLPSILGQSMAFHGLVVVEDGSPQINVSDIHALSKTAGVDISLLRNRRTPGASGAWNTGIDHLARHFEDVSTVFVAFLDDDDAWQKHHLQFVFDAIAQGGEVIATGFHRREAPDRCISIFPPSALRESDFKIGNPGIQPSALVVRLDRLLQAGLFDEALQSCTDRDLMIRLARLPKIHYTAVDIVTADHYACQSRPRLSTPGSSARNQGLLAFHEKYSSEMSRGQIDASLARAHALFNWPPQSEHKQPDRTEIEHPIPNSHSLHLVVGLISDGSRRDALVGIFSDLAMLAEDPGMTALDIIVLENATIDEERQGLEETVMAGVALGLRIRLIDMGMRDINTTTMGRQAIGPARTTLQAYLYRFASKHPECVVWILDDDMRLSPLIDSGESVIKTRLPLVSRLLELKQSGIDIAIAPYTGAPPLPALSSVRVQMVDLLATLRTIENVDADLSFPDQSSRNRSLRHGRRDYYYDLSHIETDRLETPFVLELEKPGETAEELLARLVGRLEDILSGKQLFRPLYISAEEINAFKTETIACHRGGNCFIFDIRALAAAPNHVPVVEGRPTRRSDMVWALLQRHLFSRHVVTVPLPTYHSREHSNHNENFAAENLIDDIRGFALYSTLQDALVSPGIDIAARASKYIEERLAAFRLSVYRIRGLAAELDALSYRPRFSAHANAMQVFAEKVQKNFDESLLSRICYGAKSLTPALVSDFISGLHRQLEEFQFALENDTIIDDHLRLARIESAKRVLRTNSENSSLSGHHIDALYVLGDGDEGLVMADGERVYKVFDRWNAQDSLRSIPRLQQLSKRNCDVDCLYPIDVFCTTAKVWMLTYPYEATAPYKGGLGPGLVFLMVECWRFGVVCRNLHPKNLRVTGATVRLVDYGRDLLLREDTPQFIAEFDSMCRRAFLCWRCWHRSDLAELMRRALREEALPELSGFFIFRNAIWQATGHHPTPAPELERALALRPRRTLDFGCGKAELSLSIAKQGIPVVAYDRDPEIHSRLIALNERNIFVAKTFADTRVDDGYALVICRRVICQLDEAFAISVLRDLKEAVSCDGRVLLSICHPLNAPSLSTLEAESVLERMHDTESVCSWTKRHRLSGRTLHEVHRPERILHRWIRRAGFEIAGRMERDAIDLNRFEITPDVLILELRPAREKSTSLMIKACAMEAHILRDRVMHLIDQLEAPHAFDEVILVLDSRQEDFPRQYAAGDFSLLIAESEELQRQGWIDRIVIGPEAQEECRRLNLCWLGIDRPDAHAANGAPLAAIFAGFESIVTRWLLQVDLDVVIGRIDRAHDYLSDMRRAMTSDPSSVTVALNIAHTQDIPYTTTGPYGAWRTEVRACLLDIRKMKRLRPFMLTADDTVPLPAWHRALDARMESSGATSLRGGSRQTFFVHPDNIFKNVDINLFGRMVDRISRGDLIPEQIGNVDLAQPPAYWVEPTRFESFVFVIAGRNVPPSRFKRCIDSVLAQECGDWGAIVINDASEHSISRSWESLLARHGGRITYLRNREPKGLLENTVEAIRHHIGNHNSIVVTLDADDCLLGNRVLDILASHYAAGADMTVGSMYRTDKETHYPVEFIDARSRRGGGNVWQHLRSFRKSLFDQVPDDAFRLDGRYVNLASDWALMLPLTELATHPSWVRDILYLHEPGTLRDSVYREERERTIARLIQKPSLRNIAATSSEVSDST